MKKLLLTFLIIFTLITLIQQLKALDPMVMPAYNNQQCLTNKTQVYSNGISQLNIDRINRLFYGDLWRSQIVFSSNDEFLIYVESGSNGWKSSTKLFKLELKTLKKTQLFKDFKGRFSYPTLSVDNCKLIFQFQTHNPPEPIRFDAPFFERKLFIADIKDLDKSPTRLTFQKPESLFHSELMPCFVGEERKILFSAGKLSPQARNESPKIYFADIDNNIKAEFVKAKEFNKSIEFSPVINPQTGNLFTLLNKEPDSTNFSIFRRKSTDDEKYNKISEFYTPKGVGVFDDYEDVELNVKWLTSASVSPKIACQVGNWNLFSIVMLDDSTNFNAQPKVVLEGTDKQSFARPSLAPNGNWIAYEKLNISMADKSFLIAKILGTEIWMKNLVTNKITKIADDACQPTFSPDGTKIAYFEKIEDNWEIKIFKTGIKAEEQGLLSSKINDQINSLISKLGSDDYQTRESAKIALMRLGRKILHKLKNVEKNTEDPEVKSRIEEIIEFLTSETQAETTK